MHVKSAIGILSVLLFWMVGPAGAPSARANDPAGSSGCMDDTWTPISTVMAPSARVFHTAVWTGTEMLVWGGYGGGGVYHNTGGRYDPTTDTWTAISTEGAPSPREHHTAVWTGTEMIIWGGYDGTGDLNTGGRYDPATDTWTATGTDGAPSPRWGHTAVWTGTEMIIWGGYTILNTGGRYDPVTDTWMATSLVDAPSARRWHTAVWTGTAMIIWGGGGIGSLDLLNTGDRYDPATDTWLATSTVNAPRGRDDHTAVWTGSEMIIWGGNTVKVTYGSTNTGGRYNPATNTWRATPTAGAPSPRAWHTAVWAATKMVVWGGGVLDTLDTGGRYDPASNTWAVTSRVNAPSARRWQLAIWADTEMIVWGGFYMYYDPIKGYVTGYLDTGGRYCASTDIEGKSQR